MHGFYFSIPSVRMEVNTGLALVVIRIREDISHKKSGEGS
jgi:hypothetical protein